MKLTQNDEKERTQDIRVSQSITFESLLLASNTIAGLKNAGFYRPSPIQFQGIPLGKCGFDLLLEAKSGTGKTAVFTIIALEKLDLEKGLQAIILAPTREIAVQICDVIQQLGAGYEGLKTMSVIGGMPVQEDILKIKSNNIQIVVGSPGRLRHLIQDKHLNISAVRLLVLDEADKLMEKSFLADINYIFSVLPKQKQIIMSSATYADGSKAFIEQYVQNAQHVCPENNSVLLGVKQTICIVKHNANVVKQTQYRFEELLKILTQKQFKQCLIFCNYQTRVVELKKKLNKEKWPAEHLYGQQEQSDRLDALKMLQEYKCRILVSTDLAARGIDASNVDLVINFEPPQEWQTYLHRIGRAGRFGSYGIAITIVSEGKEEKSFQLILDSLQVPINHFWHEIKDAGAHIADTQIKQCDNNAAPNCNKDQSLKQIWQCLAADTDKDKEKSETFEDLCESYNNDVGKQEQFESFSGLLNSFQNYQSECNIKLEAEKNAGLEAISEKLKIIKEYFTLNNEVEPSSFDDSNSNRVIENLNKNEDIVNISNEEQKTEGVLKVNATKAHCSRNQTLQNCNCEPQHENYTEHEIALLNAGLPTAFGKPSKKFCKIKNSATNKKEPKPKWVPKSKTECEFVEQNESQMSHDQNQYSASVHRTQTYSTNSSSSDSGFRNNSTDYLQSNIDNATYYKSSNKNQSYIIWYNELKKRVREIEYAVYIHEMSTL